jgi:tellurite methyltransferase
VGPPPGPQPWLLAHQSRLPPAGRALDLAMGLGASAGWLIQQGWRVVGVDISEIAARCAKARWPALQAIVADLSHFSLPAAGFDLILDFYYLDRALWPAARSALRPGGLFIFETFVQPPHGPPPINTAYLLQPGELRAAFADWNILDEHEGEREGRWVAGMVAQVKTHM